MRRKRESAPEYRETVVFELFPALEYDKAQKQRLIPFHAYRNSIRRIINYAAHFDAPNRICMVYIVGEVAPEKIQKLLAAAECSDRVCVLTSPFPEDELTFWRAFDERRDALQKQGNWDEERQTVTAEWLHMRDHEIWWKGVLDAAEPDLDGQICIDAPTLAVPDLWRTHNAKLVAQQAETLDMIHHYHALARKAPSYFRRWTLHRRGREPTQFRHADTGKLVAKTYPYGAEARDGYGKTPCLPRLRSRMRQTCSAGRSPVPKTVRSPFQTRVKTATAPQGARKAARTTAPLRRAKYRNAKALFLPPPGPVSYTRSRQE